MNYDVLLTIHSRQQYEGQEPDTIELATDGILHQREDGGWRVEYQESEVTGLQGVTTALDVFDRRVELTRTGAMESKMIFEENVRHDSLYQLEFGAMMLGVTGRKIRTKLDENGGSMDLVYGVQIEQVQAGIVEYHIEVKRVQS